MARQAVGEMKEQLSQQPLIRPSAVVAAMSAKVTDEVLQVMPRRATLGRALRHSRQMTGIATGQVPLPPAPTDLSFTIPPIFTNFLLFDSGPGPNRILMFGDLLLLDGLARVDLWLADGTFKVVPSIFYQLYSIHFEFVKGMSLAAVYFLLQNKTRDTYDAALTQLKAMIPLADPKRILTDFQTAAMSAFETAYPSVQVQVVTSTCARLLSEKFRR